MLYSLVFELTAGVCFFDIKQTLKHFLELMDLWKLFQIAHWKLRDNKF